MLESDRYAYQLETSLLFPESLKTGKFNSLDDYNRKKELERTRNLAFREIYEGEEDEAFWRRAVNIATEVKGLSITGVGVIASIAALPVSAVGAVTVSALNAEIVGIVLGTLQLANGLCRTILLASKNDNLYNMVDSDAKLKQIYFFIDFIGVVLSFAQALGFVYNIRKLQVLKEVKQFFDNVRKIQLAKYISGDTNTKEFGDILLEMNKVEIDFKRNFQYLEAILKETSTMTLPNIIKQFVEEWPIISKSPEYISNCISLASYLFNITEGNGIATGSLYDIRTGNVSEIFGND